MPEEDIQKNSGGKENPKKEDRAVSPLVKRLVLAGIIIAVIAIEGVIAFFLVQATKQEDPRVLAESKEKEQESAARIKQTTIGMTTDPIEVIVNITGKNEEDRYAKIAVQLEFDNTKYPELADQLVVRVPKIKNILIEQLAAMPLEDLMSPTGKVKLRKAIQREINKTIPKNTGEVRDVFISEFIIQ